jgi:hypothetical protein
MGFLGQASQDGLIDFTSFAPELPGLLQGRCLSLSRVAKLPGKYGQVSGGVQNFFQSGSTASQAEASSSRSWVLRNTRS